MSIEQPKSGIVFYPDPLNGELAMLERDATVARILARTSEPTTTESVARQFGLATNAIAHEDGHIEVGTSIAIPYDTDIKKRLYDLHDPRTGSAESQATSCVLKPDEAEEERAILDSLLAGARQQLHELGIADEDTLFDTFSRRRIDFISGVQYEERPAKIDVLFANRVGTLMRDPQGWRGPGDITAHVWSPIHGEGGTFKLVKPSGSRKVDNSFSKNHPLHPDGIDDVSEAQSRIIATANGTAEPVVREIVRYKPQTATVVTKLSPRRTRAVESTIIEHLDYDVPHDQPDLSRRIERSELQQLAHNVDKDLDDGLDELYQAGNDDQDYMNNRRDIYKRLDPATSLEWASRIN